MLLNLIPNLICQSLKQSIIGVTYLKINVIFLKFFLQLWYIVRLILWLILGACIGYALHLIMHATCNITYLQAIPCTLKVAISIHTLFTHTFTARFIALVLVMIFIEMRETS